MEKYQVNDLAIGYKKKVVARDINITFNSSGAYHLFGENGSGKTTFILTLTKHIDAISGSFDERLSDGLFFLQDSDLYDNLNGFENIQLISKKQLSDDEMIKCAKEFRIGDILNRKVKNYSYGERMRLLFVSSLFSDNNIIYFDEIDKGIDKENIKSLADHLRILAKSKLVILTSHRENKFYCDFANRIIFKDGKAEVIETKDIDNEKEREEVVENNSKPCYKGIAKFMRKALFTPVISSLFGLILAMISVLSSFLLSGSNYQVTDINKEIGYKIVTINALNSMGKVKDTIIDDDLVDKYSSAVPNYLSFANTDYKEPPIIIYEGKNEYILSPELYINTDLLSEDERKMFVYSESELIFYFNDFMIESLKKDSGIKGNVVDLKCEYIFSNEDSKLNKNIDFKVDIKPRVLEFNDTEMGLTKVYYSGENFLKHSKKNVIDIEGQKFEILDYIRNNRIENSYKSYQVIADQDILDNIAFNENGIYNDMTSRLQFSNRIYKSYITTVKENQLNPQLFLIFGLVSIVFNSLISILVAFLIRKNRSKSFLLSRIFKYNIKDLSCYLLNFALPLVIYIIGTVVSTIIFGSLALCNFVVLAVFISMFIVSFTLDLKYPYKRLICQRKTSGVD